MIQTAESSIADGIAKPASREIVSTDLVALRAELQRFERRLAFWTRRVGRRQPPGKGTP